MAKVGQSDGRRETVPTPEGGEVMIVATGNGWVVWRERHPVTGRLTRYHHYQSATTQGVTTTMLNAERQLRLASPLG